MLRGSEIMCLHELKTLTGMSLALLLLNPLMVAVHLSINIKHTTTYTIIEII